MFLHLPSYFCTYFAREFRSALFALAKQKPGELDDDTVSSIWMPDSPRGLFTGGNYIWHSWRRRRRRHNAEIIITSDIANVHDDDDDAGRQLLKHAWPAWG